MKQDNNPFIMAHNQPSSESDDDQIPSQPLDSNPSKDHVTMEQQQQQQQQVEGCSLHVDDDVDKLLDAAAQDPSASSNDTLLLYNKEVALQEEQEAAKESDVVVNEDSGRERLKRHRVEVAGRIWIPEIWGQEELLKDWIDCTAFDAPFVPSRITTARAALVEEDRRANAAGLRIENSMCWPSEIAYRGHASDSSS